MTWLVFGVSCLLVLAGAVSIISGAPIVQLERGWAEVISGTVALSSGGVVFALAVVLVRLEALRDSVAARAGTGAPVPEAIDVESLVPAAPARPAQAPVETPAPVLPPDSTPPLPEDAPLPETAPQAEHGLWKRIKRPTETSDPGQMEQQGFPDRVVTDRAPASTRVSAAASVAAAPVIVPAHVPGEQAVPPVDPTAAPDTGQIGWLERSLAVGRTARPEPAEQPAPTPFEPIGPALFGSHPSDGPERLEPLLDAIASPAESPRPQSRTLEPEPTPDLAAERHEGTNVIGRYQAGSSSYVMYSDGTIEVETEDGQVHRFGSMDELKAYIANQDTPAT